MLQVHIKLASDDAELRIVWAEVYAPGVPDTDGDFMDAATIQKMAYDFMRAMKLDQIDRQHNNQLVDGARVVESFIARKGDPDFIEGAWVVGVHVPDDETWRAIKSGEINGFSMEALVNRTQTELTFDLPPVLQGMTSKGGDDLHEHEFFVKYDAEGNLVGGATSMVNGHRHQIRRGTTTETEAGHMHRFSFVEQLYGA
jgi:hypothetical protein